MERVPVDTLGGRVRVVLRTYAVGHYAGAVAPLSFRWTGQESYRLASIARKACPR